MLLDKLLPGWILHFNSWRLLEKYMITERAYLLPNFSKEYLSKVTGAPLEKVDAWSETVYGQAFEDLLRGLRIESLIDLMMVHKGDVSIKNYASMVGYSQSSAMFEAFEEEMGMDFFEFFDEFKKRF